MLYDCEGEIGDNFLPGRSWSADQGAWLYGIVVSCSGAQSGSGGGPARYEQAPWTNSAALWTTFVYKGATESMPTWLTWCQNNWAAMYTWLNALDADDRDKAKAGCQQKLVEAQAFKDAGYLT